MVREVAVTSAGHLIGTHLVDIKVVDDGVKTGVEVVEQRHHLQRKHSSRCRRLQKLHLRPQDKQAFEFISFMLKPLVEIRSSATKRSDTALIEQATRTT